MADLTNIEIFNKFRSELHGFSGLDSSRNCQVARHILAFGDNFQVLSPEFQSEILKELENIRDDFKRNYRKGTAIELRRGACEHCQTRKVEKLYRCDDITIEQWENLEKFGRLEEEEKVTLV